MSSPQDYYHYSDQRQHVLEVPDMYVGSIQADIRTCRVYLPDDNKIIKAKVNVPQAVERIYLEILNNAADNVLRSRQANVNPGMITIELNPPTITIINGGLSIPLVIHPTYQRYVPELIFGTLLSSSNYRKERYGSGVNGLGAKLCNIFSTFFSIEIVNNGLCYQQQWSTNMSKASLPTLTPTQDSDHVKVSYIMDSNYFNYHYDNNCLQLFMRHGIDVAFNLRCPVRLVTPTMERVFNFTDPRQYAKLYLDSSIVDKGIVIEGSDHVALIFDTPDRGLDISFVNGVSTSDGGVHVKALYRVVLNVVKEIVPDVKLNDIRPHVSVIVSCWLKNPHFTGQTKTYLSSPTPKYTLTNKAEIANWLLIDRIRAGLKAKLFSKSDGKKTRFVNCRSLEDANLAGSKDSSKCILIYTEGVSASSYATKVVSLFPNGRNYWGIFSARGKPLNVMNASLDQLAENKVFNELKQALGLREGMDYTSETNFTTLRYGSLLLMADSDVDGKHIIGLVLNFFHCRYPSLLQRGFLKYLRTPIIKVQYHNQELKFYTQSSYDSWKSKVESEGEDVTKYLHRYFKGLGTSNDKDIADEFTTQPKIVICLYDDLAPDYFRVAFDEQLSSYRKQWIEQYQPILGVEDLVFQPISEFLYYELTEFMISNMTRSIPKLCDGLKESQRKALWVSYLKWKGWTINQPIKVNALAAATTELAGYKHGEHIMADTIAQMAHNFVGSNNLPYFLPEGQLGTRNRGGEDAADPRYTYVRPCPWLSYIFRPEDIPLTQQVIDEGIAIEPVTFYPIIPMVLVNGVIGIGSGYSTYLPSYNPRDLIRWLIARLHNKPYLLKPWYRGFKGTVKIVKTGKRYNSNSNNSNDDPLGDDYIMCGNEQDLSILTTGIYTVEGDKVIITELPIRRFTNAYKVWLDSLVEKRIITRYNNLSTTDEVKFEIFGLANPSSRTLRLERRFGLTNMVTLDVTNHPRRYKTVSDILEEFFSIRLEIYKQRKEIVLRSYQDKITKLTMEAKFYQLVQQGNLKIINQPRDKVKDEMRQYGLDPSLLTTTRLVNCTLEEIKKKLALVEHSKQEMESYRNTPVETIWERELNELDNMLSQEGY